MDFRTVCGKSRVRESTQMVRLKILHNRKKNRNPLFQTAENLVDQYLHQEQEILIHQIKNEFGTLIRGLKLDILRKTPFFQQAGREGSD